MQSELNRQYLAAMGIQVWLPRDRAAAVREDSSAALDPVLQQTEHPQPGSPQVSDVAVRETAAGLSDEVSSPARQPLEAGQSAPRFRLSAFHVPGVAAVVADIGVDGNAEQVRHEYRFLSDLLFALVKTGAALPKPAQFDWPMFEQANMDQSEAVAMAAVRAFCNAQLRGQTIPCLLLFGPRAQACLETPKEWQTELSTTQSICFPALREHLGDAELKRTLWLRLSEIVGG